MTNEEIVADIKKGILVKENMEKLFTNNLPLIKKTIKQYAFIEAEEDLLQECYFALLQAVEQYRNDKNAKFITYLLLCVKWRIAKYIKNSGNMSHILSLDKIYESEDGTEKTLVENIKADLNIENDIVEKIYDQHLKNELWDIVEEYTTTLENEIIIDIFKNNMYLKEIAEKYNISKERVRQIRIKGLKKLSFGKAKRKILEEFEILDAGLFRGGLNDYKSHNATSKVEYIAMRRMEI
jgi:RNA polymerase sigma factor (sigma-70 family)